MLVVGETDEVGWRSIDRAVGVVREIPQDRVAETTLRLSKDSPTDVAGIMQRRHHVTRCESTLREPDWCSMLNYRVA